MKETQKQQIERLENKVKSDFEMIQKLNDEIYKYQDNANKDFENSSTYRQMLKEIEDLKLKVKVVNDSSNHNRNMYESELKRNDLLVNEIHKLKDELKENHIAKVKNERGAGRKIRFTDKEKETIKMYRSQGKTIKELSEMFCCSVGLIHKLISE